MKKQLNGILKKDLKNKVLDMVQQYDVSTYLDCVITVYDEYTEKYQAYEGILLHINRNVDLYHTPKYIIVYIDDNFDDIQVSYQDHMLNITNMTKSNLLDIDDVIEKAMDIKTDLGKLIRYTEKECILEQLEYIQDQVLRIYNFIDQNF